MQSSWLYVTSAFTITCCITILMVLFYILGYRLKVQRIKKHPEYSDEGFGESITIRKASRETTFPDSILYLLFALCCASGFIVGYASKKAIDWIMVAGFAPMIGVTIFSILDLDRPHRGLITLDKAQQDIIELKELLKD